MQVGLARSVERLDRCSDDRRVQVRAGLVAGTGRVDGPSTPLSTLTTAGRS